MRFLVSGLTVATVGPIAVAVFLLGGGERRVAPEPEAIPVTVAEAKAAQDAETVEATGTLVLKRETQLSFKVSGIIAELAVRVGDAVKADQVLARLDQTEISARDREARAQYDLARKEYDRASELFRRGFVAARRVDDAKAALERAQSGSAIVGSASIANGPNSARLGPA